MATIDDLMAMLKIQPVQRAQDGTELKALISDMKDSLGMDINNL